MDERTMTQPATIKDAWRTPVYVGGAPSEMQRNVWRFKQLRRPGRSDDVRPARVALAMARSGAFDTRDFCLTQYCPASDDGLRWVEHVSHALRFVGYADKLASLKHTGWYTYEGGDPSELMRGVVYRLPHGRFVAGYDEGESTRKGWRPMNPGGARLDFSETYTDEMEAARAADRVAEICAEKERDYHTAWEAARQCEDLAQEAKAARQNARALLRERRALRIHAKQAPTICARLKTDVTELLREARKARKEISELVERFGENPGFADS